jgi:hypothetical protein
VKLKMKECDPLPLKLLPSSHLGWTPKQDHTSGFRKTVEWYLDNESVDRAHFKRRIPAGTVGDGGRRRLRGKVEDEGAGS